MSRLLNNDPKYLDPLVAKNEFSETDTYTVADTVKNDVLADEGTVQRNKLLAKNSFNETSTYNFAATTKNDPLTTTASAQNAKLMAKNLYSETNTYNQNNA